MLGMVHHEFGNGEVEFTISIPWKTEHGDEFEFLMTSLYYLQENFGIDPMSCNDSYWEEA